jgi:serine protease
MKKAAALTASFAVVAALGLAHHAQAQQVAPSTDEPTVHRTPIREADALLESDGPSGYISGEIVVDVVDDASDEEIAELGRKYGVSLRDNSPGIKHDGNIELADLDESDVDSVMEKLSHDPRVERVERNAYVAATFVPNDPKYAEQWHMPRVKSETAWEYSCGAGVTVAVIDTGVACYDKAPFTKGTDLKGTECVAGYDFVNDRDEAADDHGHGTHVAGTIAQTTNNGTGVAGLAFCAKLMPIKVLSRQGYGTTADVAEGIRWAADHGAQVINLSLGGPIKSSVLQQAVEHAHKKGVTIVAAAGNSGRSVGYPAAYPEVIAVSATDRNDKIAYFSSRGPQIAIGAPGVQVTQQTICDGGRNKCEQWGVFSGTSMASPHVAGAAALVVGLGVTDPDAVRDVLQTTAVPKDDPKLYGAGILDAGAAASRTHWKHTLLRLGALAGIFLLLGRWLRKKNGAMARTPGAIGGALIGAVGLLPLAPLAKIPAMLGAVSPSLRTAGELSMRPFGEWDILFSAGVHKWLPLANALPVMALTALLFGAKRLRPTIGGFAIGTAALLTQMAVSADVSFVLGSTMLRAWTMANALVCLWIARLAIDKKD